MFTFCSYGVETLGGTFTHGWRITARCSGGVVDDRTHRPETPDHHTTRVVCKNSREHTFPYGDMVAAKLESVPRLNSTDLLFPSAVSDDRPISGWSKYKKRLGDGVPAWRLHDLRRTFGTTLVEIPHVVERLLNHSMGAIGNQADSVVSAVAEVYNLAKYMPKMRNAIEHKWEPFLQNLTRAA